MLLLLLLLLLLRLLLSFNLGAEIPDNQPREVTPQLIKPNTPSCRVTLFEDAHPSPVNVLFNLPADCPYPWSRVILSFANNGTMIWDKSGAMFIGDAMIFKMTTPEGAHWSTSIYTPWSVEKDITIYSNWMSKSNF